MKEYVVYEHVFPNGKRYIGISSNHEKRWRGGKGYETQPKMQHAIDKYGWDNVQHNIVLSGLTEEQAKNTEQFLISELDTIENGYNVDIGGNAIFSFYLCEPLLDMIRAARSIQQQHKIELESPLWDAIYADRKDRKASDSWNTLYREAIKLYSEEESLGKYPSATDDLDVARFWGCFAWIVDDFYAWAHGLESKPYIHTSQIVENLIEGGI